MRGLSEITWAEVIAAVSAIGAWVTSWYATRKVREVHILINSRLTKLLELTKSDSFAAGGKAEREKHE